MSTYRQELEDLKVFRDPFSESEFLATENDEWTARFERKGKNIFLRRAADGKIFHAASGELVAGSFKSLLASEDFSYIKYLARSLSFEYRSTIQNFMNIPFQINGDVNVNDFNSVKDFLSKLNSGGVVGLEGPAGAGKTHFIERLAAERAANMLLGTSTESLVIPVASAGKILSAIDDRIDGSLSALRANFNRSELPCLMRNGLVSIAIDGFDELSDSRGYDNSWAALRELLRDIGAGGLILLSGRDSFISGEILKEVIGVSVDAMGTSIYSLSIGFPSASDVCSWIARENQSWESRLEEAEERFGNFSWLRRPFFVSQIGQMDPDSFLDSGDEPIISLCSSMVTREVDKIGMPAEISRKSGEDIVYSILTEAARTMLDYEIDYVDQSLLEIAVEVACEEHAPDNENFSRALSARAKTLSLLEPAPGTGNRDNRRFPHEKIKAFFYGRYLASEILKDAPPPLGLRRGQLTISDLSVFGALLRTKDSSLTRDLFQSLQKRLIGEASGMTYSGNLAALLIACLPEDGQDEHVTISGWQVLDVVFPDNPIGTLKNVYLNRMDARGSNLSHIKFEDCQVGEAIISEDTRFGEFLPKIHTLIIEKINGIEEVIHDDINIKRKIYSVELIDKSEERPEIPETLEILVRLMLRGHWVRLSRDDKRGKRILDRYDWEEIRSKLEAHGLLEVKNLGASGKPSEFVHLKKASDFLSLPRRDSAVMAAINDIRGSIA